MCPMVELTLNSRVSVTTGYRPFELNYGYIPRLAQHIDAITKYAGVKQFAQQALWNLTAAHNAIIESHVIQAHHANSH